MIRECWAQIVEVHNEAKTLFLLAEEIEPERFQEFIQPINEHRHSLEHIIRAKADELGLGEEEASEEYQRSSLKKTLGHEYRAFFDCADWIAVILREDILETLQPYDPSCIQAVLPEYYKSLRARILDISEAIAEIRSRKDISREPRIVEQVGKYKEALDELRTIHRRVIDAVPSLEDFRAKARKGYRKDWVWGVVAGLLVACVVAAASFLVGRWTKHTLTPPRPGPSSADTQSSSE